MLASFQILSSVSGKSIMLTISNKKYVFNIFEGFQRLCLENNLSLGSINTFFLPSKLSVPGFLAVYLTIGNNKCTRNITVVSDSLLKYQNIFNFIGEQDINLELLNNFEDKHLKVTPWYIDGVANYILEFSEFRNKFLVKNVPKEIPRTLYKRLSNSEVVTYKGIEYDGSKYCESPIKLEKMCVIFTYGAIEVLLEANPDVKVFLCMNRNALRNIKRYKRKDIKVYHVLNNQFIDFESFYETQKELNNGNASYLMPISLDKEYLNVNDLQEKIRKKESTKGTGDITETNDGESVLNRITKRSDKKEYIRQTDCYKSITNGTQDTGNCIEKVEINIKNGDKLEFSREESYFLNQSILKTREKGKNNRKVNHLTFLGTSCAIPTKYRNVSSILYESTDAAMLIDCGEDTSGQIIRIFGDCTVLEKLKVIYLSHSHADHVLGVASILNLVNNKITIVGPGSYKEFLKDISGKEFDYIETDGVKILERKFYHEQFYRRSKKEKIESLNDDKSTEDRFNDINGISEIILKIDEYSLIVETEYFLLRICGCCHSIDSTSVCITDKLSKKLISYSGDSVPSLLFAACAYNSDLMIHESTFSVDQKKNAEATKHSTNEDAEAIFKYSISKKLIMTHFSNRNHCIPVDKNHAVDFYMCEL